jgi:hypothetical protein
MAGLTTVGDLAILLPDNNIPEGWAGTTEPTIFEGDALFRFINGGAELFHGHGFVALVVRDYAKESSEARVEIYDMGSDEGASGIFAENTEGLTTTEEFGVRSSVDEYQILFHKGRFYISITNYTGEEPERTAMAALAEAVSEKIE